MSLFNAELSSTSSGFIPVLEEKKDIKISSEPAKIDNTKKNVSSSKLWNGLKFTFFAIYDATTKSFVIAICGIAAKSFSMALSLILLGNACGLFITKLVVNIVDEYNGSSLINSKMKIRKFHENYPKARIISILVSVVIASINPVAGFAFSAVKTSIFDGLTIQGEQSKELITMDASDSQETKSKTIDSVV